MTTLELIDARLARHRAILDELTTLRAEVAATVPAVATMDGLAGNASGAIPP